MTTAFVIVAALILIAGLFAVIVERAEERDDARSAFEAEAADNIRLRVQVAALEAEAMHLHLKLTEAQLLTGRNPRALDDDAWFAQLCSEGWAK